MKVEATFITLSRHDCSAFDEANVTQIDLEICHLHDFSLTRVKKTKVTRGYEVK